MLSMDAAQTIRDAVARVGALRLKSHANPALHAATVAVKRFQAQRFEATYSDLLVSQEYAAATRFFLDELYSDKDYTLRDAQFARIAGALQTFFPAAVVATAVALAELHVLTEELDLSMAEAWLTSPPLTQEEQIDAYVRAWKQVGRTLDREQQLIAVLTVGSELDRFTQMPGLRMMLRMMRRPANAAGLGSLQRFLEAGFDTFAGMSGKRNSAQTFLALIQSRESYWIQHFFADDLAATLQLLKDALSRTETMPC